MSGSEENKIRHCKDQLRTDYCIFWYIFDNIKDAQEMIVEVFELLTCLFHKKTISFLHIKDDILSFQSQWIWGQAQETVHSQHKLSNSASQNYIGNNLWYAL